jgi:hypothetical protein
MPVSITILALALKAFCKLNAISLFNATVSSVDMILDKEVLLAGRDAREPNLGRYEGHASEIFRRNRE